MRRGRLVAWRPAARRPTMTKTMAHFPPSTPAFEARNTELDEEDRADLEDARAALREFKESGQAAISLEDVLASYGLTRADLSK